MIPHLGIYNSIVLSLCIHRAYALLLIAASYIKKIMN